MDRNHMKKGASAIEVIMVMILLLGLGILTFQLVVSGSKTYEKEINESNVISDLRLAGSYLDNKVKQGDYGGAIDIKNNPVTMKPALVLSEDIEGDLYETWIYQQDGILWEAFIPKGQEPLEDVSFEICPLDEFQLVQNNNLIHGELVRTIGTKSQRAQVYFRVMTEGE